MQISTTSWHFKLLETVDMVSVYHEENLCCYFWKLVFTLLVTTIIGVCGLVTAPIWLPIFVIIACCFWIESKWAPKERLGVWYRQQRQNYWNRTANPGPREPSIFVAWFKAKKARVCPLIEFVTPPAVVEKTQA